MEVPPPSPVDWLSGLRVCLCAHYVPGPLAAYLLRCMGAEVIKVEPPFHDMLRQFPPFLQGSGKSMGAWFRSLNAGFQSIVIDFRKPEGAATFRQLLSHCDVLIDGNRPGQLARVLGAHPNAALPDLIYVPISAYGQVGPMRDIAGHDGNLLALSGNLSYTAAAQGGGPAMFSAPIADILSAHTAALCALAGVMGRDKVKSKLRSADTSMLHSAFFLNQMQVAAMNVVAEPPRHDHTWMNGGLANYRTYHTADHKAVFFGPIEPHLFAEFCHLAERPDLASLVYADNDRLYSELKSLFASKPLAEWENLLAGSDCCFSAVNDLQQGSEQPQVQALGLIQQVEDPLLGALKLAGFPAGFGLDSAPPQLPVSAPQAGEHTRGILRELLGYSPGQIAELLELKAVLG